MTLWLDNQLPAVACEWLRTDLGLEARHISNFGLAQETDTRIFNEARSAGVDLLSKDVDFVDLVRRRGAPPRLIWLTCGNVPNARLRDLLRTTLPKALAVLASGEDIVEIN